MKSSFHGLRARAAGALAGAGAAFYGATAWAADNLGQPTNGAIDLQPGVTPLRLQAISFHNHILLPIITAITLFVLALLVWVIVRYNRRANPVPAKWSHNTPVEVVWTVLPVLILMFIAIFSFRLLFAYNDMPKPDLTIKATGYQWYWGYEYPDQKVAEITSTLLPEDQAKAKGVPYRLAADNAMVVPVGKVVRVLVTGSDVIHSFAMPAFGLKTDAIPGRVNETWFKAEKVGTYYGQCSELCGVDHAFMPIQINVVSDADFAAWVAGHGGSMTPAKAQVVPAAATAPAAAAPASSAAPAAASSAPAAAPSTPAATQQQPASGATPAPQAQ
jgi:cytochrome c oxidase subunit 2